MANAGSGIGSTPPTTSPQSRLPPDPPLVTYLDAGGAHNHCPEPQSIAPHIQAPTRPLSSLTHSVRHSRQARQGSVCRSAVRYRLLFPSVVTGGP